MAHGAPHDAAQDVAAPLVGGQHAVGDQEGRCAQMIGDDAVAGAVFSIRLDAGRLHARLDQRAEKVDVVIVVLALQHRRDALQAHAGVDRRLGQAHALAGADLLELHEDEVPDLDEPVAVLLGTARRPAPDVIAMIVEDLRARTARAGIAHRPEIVRRGDADDAVVRKAGDLLPQSVRLVVLVIDGDDQPVLVEAEFAS